MACMLQRNAVIKSESRPDSLIMLKHKMICPDCNAVIITSSPVAMIWERCPHCAHHVWDMYDALMADVCTQSRSDACAAHTHAAN